MQVLLETLATLIAALATAAFAQFGIDLQPSEKKPDDREVRRTDDHAVARKTDAVFIRPSQDC